LISVTAEVKEEHSRKSTILITVTLATNGWNLNAMIQLANSASADQKPQLKRKLKMAKKLIKKISDKLTKVNDNLTVNILDNGFFIEVSGRDAEDNWATAKIMCANLNEVNDLIKEVSEMDKA
jgi:hypothetical protein